MDTWICNCNFGRRSWWKPSFSYVEHGDLKNKERQLMNSGLQFLRDFFDFFLWIPLFSLCSSLVFQFASRRLFLFWIIICILPMYLMGVLCFMHLVIYLKKGFPRHNKREGKKRNDKKLSSTRWLGIFS